MRLIKWILLFAFITGCASEPLSEVGDVCKIFHEKPRWYWATLESEDAWGVSPAIQMAIIHQESKFEQYARPPRQWILGFIPWFRPSSAFGYAQVLETTWKDYLKAIGKKRSRADFASATDFIGWYARNAQKRTPIDLDNANDLYLAYHEGAGGFSRKTYQSKPWLINVAKKVSKQSEVYQQQLAQCEAALPKKSLWNRLVY